MFLTTIINYIYSVYVYTILLSLNYLKVGFRNITIEKCHNKVELGSCFLSQAY